MKVTYHYLKLDETGFDYYSDNREVSVGGNPNEIILKDAAGLRKATLLKCTRHGIEDGITITEDSISCNIYSLPEDDEKAKFIIYDEIKKVALNQNLHYKKILSHANTPLSS